MSNKMENPDGMPAPRHVEASVIPCYCCKYYSGRVAVDRENGDVDPAASGFCKRYPPALVDSGSSLDQADEDCYWVSPAVWSGDGCGEHQPRK